MLAVCTPIAVATARVRAQTNCCRNNNRPTTTHWPAPDGTKRLTMQEETKAQKARVWLVEAVKSIWR